MRIKTVQIESNGAALIINASDFDPKSHTLWEDRKVSAQPKPEKAEVENDVITEHKGGGRWVVIVNGKPVHEGSLPRVDAKALAAEY